MAKDRTGPQGTSSKLGTSNFDGIRQQHAKVDCRFFASVTWNAFESARGKIHCMHDPIKVKGKAGRRKEFWMMREIEALVRKKETWVKYRQLESNIYLER